MILNDIEVDEAIIERILKLTDLPGDQHPGLKLREYIANSQAAEAFQAWITAGSIDFFDKTGLEQENDDLAISLPLEAPYLLANVFGDRDEGPIEPSKLILIAHSLLLDDFLGLYKEGNGLSVMMSGDFDGKFFWRRIYPSVEEFLSDLGF